MLLKAAQSMKGTEFWWESQHQNGEVSGGGCDLERLGRKVTEATCP